MSQLYLPDARSPSGPQELEIGLKHLATGSSRDVAFDDLVWAILNSREFITNH